MTNNLARQSKLNKAPTRISSFLSVFRRKAKPLSEPLKKQPDDSESVFNLGPYRTLATIPVSGENPVPSVPEKKWRPFKKAIFPVILSAMMNFRVPGLSMASPEPIEESFEKTEKPHIEKIISTRVNELQTVKDKNLIDAAKAGDLQSVLRALGQGTTESAKYQALAEVLQKDQDASSDANLIITHLRYSLSQG